MVWRRPLCLSPVFPNSLGRYAAVQEGNNERSDDGTFVEERFISLRYAYALIQEQLLLLSFFKDCSKEGDTGDTDLPVYLSGPNDPLNRKRVEDT